MKYHWFVLDKLPPLLSIWWALKRAQEGREIQEIKGKLFWEMERLGFSIHQYVLWKYVKD
jgi:hypothetical protein